MKRNKKQIKEIVAEYWPIPLQQEIEAAGNRVLNRLRAELESHDTSLRSLYGDGWSTPYLKQHEFQVLTAAVLLNGQGTASQLRNIVETWTGHDNLAVVPLTSCHRGFPSGTGNRPPK